MLFATLALISNITWAQTPDEISTCPIALAALPDPFSGDARLSAARLLVVFKRAERIGLYEHGKLSVLENGPACYPVAMGSWPYEPKYRRDYISTPEGWYEVSAKRTSDPSDDYPWTAFGQSLGVSYPNRQDIERARERGTLDDIGGGILIHAWDVGSGAKTHGCVGVDDDNMAKLFNRVRMHDPILLLPWSLML